VTDPTRVAAAVLLEELAAQADRLAKRLRSEQPLPPLAVGRLLVEADRMNTRLSRHADRLRPQEPKR
jgi:hypothetical protein